MIIAGIKMYQVFPTSRGVCSCFKPICYRKIGAFNASQELPYDLEDSLVLWINKVSNDASSITEGAFYLVTKICD